MCEVWKVAPVDTDSFPDVNQCLIITFLPPSTASIAATYNFLLRSPLHHLPLDKTTERRSGKAMGRAVVGNPSNMLQKPVFLQGSYGHRDKSIVPYLSNLNIVLWALSGPT